MKFSALNQKQLLSFSLGRQKMISWPRRKNQMRTCLRWNHRILNHSLRTKIKSMTRRMKSNLLKKRKPKMRVIICQRIMRLKINNKWLKLKLKKLQKSKSSQMSNKNQRKKKKQSKKCKKILQRLNQFKKLPSKKIQIIKRNKMTMLRFLNNLI